MLICFGTLLRPRAPDFGAADEISFPALPEQGVDAEISDQTPEDDSGDEPGGKAPYVRSVLHNCPPERKRVPKHNAPERLWIDQVLQRSENSSPLRNPF
jgi:hypothetical protein